MLPDDFKAEFKTRLPGFKQKVKVLYFTSKTACNACAEGLRFIEELAKISDKLIMVVHDMDEKPELAESCGVDKVPAYVLLAESGRDYGIRFFGVPSGEAVESFAYALSLIAKAVEITADATLEKIMDVTRPVHMEVFTTPQCPVCAEVIQTAHLIAYINDNIRADMIDTKTFPALAKKYNIQSVPKIVLNETVELIDKQTTEMFLEAINRLYNPN
jgi:glutaredoxin-like protein